MNDHITITLTEEELDNLIDFIDSNFIDVIKRDVSINSMDWIRMMIQLRDNLVRADKEWRKEHYR